MVSHMFFSHYYAKIKVDSYDSYDSRKNIDLWIILNNVTILIKSALNSDLNQYYNPGHNILCYFEVWQNFRVTTSETNLIISNKHDIYELPHELPNNLRLRTLGN